MINPNGGSWNGSTSNQSFTQNNNTTKYIANPTRNGYAFKNWSVSNTTYGSLSGTTYTFGNVNGVTNTLTANWTANTYTLTYNNTGGSGCTTKSVAYKGTYGTLCTPARSNYTFKGWYTSTAYNSVVTSSTVCNGNATIYAKWEQNAPAVVSSTLKINPNSGYWSGSNSIQTFTETSGVGMVITDPVRTGYTFSGWQMSNPSYGTLSNYVYTFGNVANVTNTLTAQWTKTNTSYTFTCRMSEDDGYSYSTVTFNDSEENSFIASASNLTGWVESACALTCDSRGFSNYDFSPVWDSSYPSGYPCDCGLGYIVGTCNAVQD